MTEEGIAKLKDHEGLRLKPYMDTVGKISIGWGRNLDDVGISQDEAERLLTNDIERAQQQAYNNFPWFYDLDPVRRDVVLMLIFNMGVAAFSGFHNMIQALTIHNWHQAAYELSNSKWATQVGTTRKNDLTNALEKGEWS